MSEAHISVPTHAIEGPSGIPTPESVASRTEARPRLAAAATRSVFILQKVFSFQAMLGAALIARVFYEGRAFVVDPDLWWHIKVGQRILDTHHWPATDPFSFTVAGNPWIAYEWLGDVLIATVARIGGLAGLDLLLIALASIVILALYGYASAMSGNSKAGFLTAGVLCALAFASFSLRPQMLGYLFLILLLIAIERFRQSKPRMLWFAPLLFLLWVNTHGSFIVGLGVLFVHWAAGLKSFRAAGIEAHAWSQAERIRLEIIFLLCLAVLPLTPYGTQPAVYPLDMAFSQPLNVGNILEWQSMPFDIVGGKLFLALILGFFFAHFVLEFRWRLAEVVLLFGAIASACLHVRMVMLFVPFFAPMFAAVVARWLPPYDRSKDRFVLNATLIAGIFVGMVHYFPSSQDFKAVVARTFPINATEYLRQNPVPGPMFNTYGFGGYLLYSDVKVFVDGRADLFERGGVLGDYLYASHLKSGTLAVLRNYGIQSCLLQHGEPLATLLTAQPDWKQVYRDDVSVVFVRRDLGALAKPVPALGLPTGTK